MGAVTGFEPTTASRSIWRRPKLAGNALADPCGMVPPIAVQTNPNAFLKRTGDQLTFVYYKDGIADMILQPAFEGQVTEFGMLIPFPAPI